MIEKRLERICELAAEVPLAKKALDDNAVAKAQTVRRIVVTGMPRSGYFYSFHSIYFITYILITKQKL